MPCGAKKRKALKKKKQKENNTNNPQGNDALKPIDEKGSDGGEGDSPAHHEHEDNRNPFNDGSEEGDERGPLASQPRVSGDEEVPSDVKIYQVLLGGKKDGVVLVERVLKSEEFSESKNESPEQIAKESYYENGNGGNILKVEALIERNSEDGNHNSVEEATASLELVKSIDSSPSKMTSVTETAQVEEMVNSAADSVVSSVKALAPVSEMEKSDTGSVLLEKSVVHHVEIKKNEDNVYPLTNGNVITSSVEEPKPKEYDIEVLVSVHASPFNKFTNGAEHIKDSETAERSENQDHRALAPNVVQKTSWLSCCGLFEVLSSAKDLLVELLLINTSISTDGSNL